MEDENGHPISKSQQDAARYRARLFWNELLKRGKAPPTGQKVDLQVRDEFLFVMEENFLWLRYCENHWKCDQLWSNHYPHWLSSQKGKVVDVTDVNSKHRRTDGETDDPHPDEFLPPPPPLPPRPVPTKRPKVCSLFFLTATYFANDLQPAILYKILGIPALLVLFY